MKESIIDVIVAFNGFSPILAPRLSASQVEISRGFIADFPLHGAVFPVFSPFFYIYIFRPVAPEVGQKYKSENFSGVNLWSTCGAAGRGNKIENSPGFGRDFVASGGEGALETKLKILPDLVVTLWQAAARGL